MELRDYLRILRAHWVALSLCIVLGVAVAFAWTLLQPKVYTADASGYVTPAQAQGQTDSSSAYVSDNLAKSKVKSYVDLGTWRAVGEHARDELGLDVSPESLVRRVSVSNPVDTVVIKVDATGPTPEAARDLAGAWIRGMQIEIESIESGGTGVNPGITLVTADSARLPSTPSSPNVRLALAIGGLVGLVVGIGYALLRFTLDRRIRSAEGVERETGLNVVGAIPEEKSFTADNRLIPFDGANTSSSRNVHLYAVSEAVRELRTNIQFMDVDNPPRILVITSPLPGEGKSTTAANLAITLAASGQRVVLIDGDLRRPMVATIFHLIGDAGLTDILAGRASFDDVAQPVGRLGTLQVVAAGKIPPNPSEILGSQRMRDLVHALSEDAVVIVDAPPLIPVTDAAVLANRTDGAIIVTTVGRTTFDALKKAQQNLERAGGRALGVVLNRVPRKGSGAAYYGYQYTGTYYRADDAASPELSPAAATATATLVPATPATALTTPTTEAAFVPEGRRARRARG
ncbi:polysaccharide biosynthesis tyrosine autokinase [Microbacterium oleivorans]|uniref:non-specific protein-tyrosine kinase n=1 Tax=Microbacterium oleivorans TaxID=273677 RepID=A0A7D5IWU6_9MICO|nr:polysaccharide biosynthesis tyrosine autokinase [Microbacterium oleivorans]QLD12242.1 polysaccharide biosynthesis tyrosine autokinase [Microbacterium oleivorans]